MKRNMMFLIIGIAFGVLSMYVLVSVNPEFLKKKVSVSFEEIPNESETPEMPIETIEPNNSEDDKLAAEEEVLTVESNRFYIQGIALGMSRSEVNRKMGPAHQEGVDEIGQDYQEYDDFTLFYYNDFLYLIIRPTPEIDFEANFWSKFVGEKYKYYDGSVLYLYLPSSNDLIFFKDDGDGHILYLTSSDGNFDYGVETGDIIKVE